MNILSKAKQAGKRSVIVPAVLLGISAIAETDARAQERDRLDELVICSAIFNASVGRTAGEELRNDYIQETVSYAEAALALAGERGMGEQEFQSYAMNLGESITIEESALPAERARCRSNVPITEQ